MTVATVTVAATLSAVAAAEMVMVARGGAVEAVETAAAAEEEEEKGGAAMVSAAAAAVRWAGEAGWAEGGAGPGSVGTVVSTEAVGSKEGGVVAKVGLSVVWWCRKFCLASSSWFSLDRWGCSHQL